jgi:hypothetical protein
MGKDDEKQEMPHPSIEPLMTSHLKGCCSVITGSLLLFSVHCNRSVYFLQQKRLEKRLYSLAWFPGPFILDPQTSEQKQL